MPQKSVPRTASPDDLSPYLGRYIANFGAFSNDAFTIFERNGRLVLDMAFLRLGKAVSS